ncbi:conserved hypothetical protein [Thermosulfidibacter takaii ABI70S6]|uniref:DUF4197 domain-containing protein n=1 Tax=Thermosulfidibacter takaii (strain DSM 17441 / JCM 13301 / NBRC 103674 / ABI70S6) TaxID=1298851 RepID=A0A0S3QSU2_THET7|nr:DUF4197 domain-containing protein [Thermosulfidibacter takaii]BAT71400.1 conserved hypothetical protein [Thermosulfidibacter takaii ABI70S6]
MRKFIISTALVIFLANTACFAGFWDTLKGMASKATSSSQKTETDENISPTDIGMALKQALEMGVKKAWEEASKPGGFLNNPLIHIPLPPKLQKIAFVAKQLGLESQVKEFEKTLNIAAEKAAKKALPILLDAVKQLTFEDVKEIWKGSDTAATEYLKNKTYDKLYKEFLPIVDNATDEVGVTRYYKSLINNPKLKSFLQDSNELDLDKYVTQKALDGLFTLIAQQEKEIRRNPMLWTTDLLKKVFGSLNSK